jgi:hypothetical protein
MKLASHKTQNTADPFSLAQHLDILPMFKILEAVMDS